MSKKSDWKFPADLAVLSGFPVLILAYLAGSFFSLINHLATANMVALFWTGLGLGCLGIVLLYLARLPLYRQRQFLTFGPRALPPFHRKLYWSAYISVLAGILLLEIVWLRAR